MKPLVAATVELTAETKEGFERPEGPAETFLRIGRQAVADDQLVERREHLGRDDDPSHCACLQLVEGSAFAPCELVAATRDRLPSAGDAIQNFDHRPSIDVGVVDRPREK
jgi:hypothetical protein